MVCWVGRPLIHADSMLGTGLLVDGGCGDITMGEARLERDGKLEIALLTKL